MRENGEHFVLKDIFLTVILIKEYHLLISFNKE